MLKPILLSACFALPFAGAVLAQQAPAGEVRFAQVAPFEGGPVEAARAMETGIRVAFEAQNAAGGVHGRSVYLDAYDDSYQPNRTVVEVKRLLEEDVHMGFIGMYGTATGAASQPLASRADWPFIGALTGADFLRAPDLDEVFNVRQTYANEMEAATAYLVDELGLERVAILYQDDGLGLSGRSGVLRALEARGLTPVVEVPYVRKTTAVKVGLLETRRAGAEAVAMVALRGAAEVFIRKADELDYNPVFISNSIVGSDQLAESLGALTEGLLVTQVVPVPFDASLPIVADYQAAMRAHAQDEDLGFISLEGYVAGRIALRALEAAGPNADRAALMAALQALGEFDLGGLQVCFGPQDNQGLTEIFVTRMDGAGGYSVEGRSVVEPASSTN